VGLHPVAAILSLLIGAKVFGIFGALIATPLVAAAWVVIASIYRSAKGETPDQMLGRKRTTWKLRRSTRDLGEESGGGDTPEEKDEISTEIV
jgi:hypothetical protein